MNISLANHLITHLEKGLDWEKPISPQLPHLFVPSLWGQGIVLPHSLHGRLSHWLKKKEGRAEAERKIKTILTQAFHTINSDKKAYQSIPLSSYIPLHKFLLEKDGSQQKGDIHQETLSPELQHLWQVNQEKAKVEAERDHHLSILRDRVREENLSYLETANFAKLFDHQEKITPSLLPYLEEFLLHHPQHANQRLSEILPLLNEAQTFNHQLEARLLQASRQIDPGKLREEAQGLSTHVRSLEVGKRWMFCGSYGKRIASLHTLFDFLRLLPQDDLPAFIQGVLKEKELPDPEKFIETLIQEGSKQLDQLPTDELSFLKSLMRDDSRSLPDQLVRWLPTFISHHLEGWVKRGVLENLIKIAPSQEIRHFLSWIVENSPLLTDEQKRADFIRESEQKLTQFIQTPIHLAKEEINKAIFKFSCMAQSNLPPSIQELIGLDSLFQSGQFWLPEVAVPSYFMPQGVSADLIATKYGISRDDCDAYAVESQKRTARPGTKGASRNRSCLSNDINGLTMLARDEHPRPDTNMQGLAALNPSFEIRRRWAASTPSPSRRIRT